jgi:VWFA-related protein
MKSLFMSFITFMTFMNPQQAPFRAAVDLVEVDVTAIDRNGKPVTDLTAADFEIREGGQPQRIDTIYLVTSDPALLHRPGTTSSPESPAPGVVPRRPLQPRVFVFIFDMTHLSAAGFDRSRTAIRSFFNDGMRPNDLAGLVVNGVMLGNRIASDKKTLLDLLDGVGPPNLTRYNEMRAWPRLLSEEEAVRVARNDEKAREAVLMRACSERPGDCEKQARFAVEAEIDNKSRQVAAETVRDGQLALTTMLTLARGLGKFPGPKQVILFSEGFYTGEFQEQVKEVAGLAARNRVRISTLDARGLGRDLRQQQLLGEAPVVGTTDFGANLGFDENADVLTTLALDTGGQRVRDRNDLRPALDAIAAESGTYYMLGYSPREPFDGSYRTIQVRTTRPGVTIRARRGYLAAKVSDPAAAAELPTTAPDRTTAAGAAAAPTTAAAAPAAVPAAVPTAPPTPTPSAAAPAPAVKPSPDPGAGGVRLRPDGPANVAKLSEPGASSPVAPDRAARLAREGWDLYSAGKVDAARDRLAEASAAGGGIWVDYALGLAEFALDHFDAATAAWERVRARKPDFEPVYFDLADAYRRLDRSDDVLAILRETAHRWPADPDAHNAVGVVLLRRGAIDDAIDAFNKAASAAPSDSIAYFNLGRAYQFRYQRMLSTVGQKGEAGRSVADRDRQSALENYKKHVALGGPLADQAREAISVLTWR